MLDIKVYISVKRNIWDINGQWVPPGNYFFNINKIDNDIYTGKIISKQHETETEYSLSGIQLISTMARGQAMLFRRVNINLENDKFVPTYDSPSNSPIRRYPKFAEEFDLSKSYFIEEPEDKPICSICLLEFNNNSTKLVCDHMFHKQCIVRWLELNNSCPVCRKKINYRNMQVRQRNNRQQRQERHYERRNRVINSNESTIINSNVRNQINNQLVRNVQNDIDTNQNVERIVLRERRRTSSRIHPVTNVENANNDSRLVTFFKDIRRRILRRN